MSKERSTGILWRGCKTNLLRFTYRKLVTRSERDEFGSGLFCWNLFLGSVLRGSRSGCVGVAWSSSTAARERRAYSGGLQVHSEEVSLSQSLFGGRAANLLQDGPCSPRVHSRFDRSFAEIALRCSIVGTRTMHC